ncbi:MAG: hypothetical protein ACFE9L_14430 [Candidatus Hodarchaeota archaeon]
MISITIELMAAIRNPFASKKRRNELTFASPRLLKEVLREVGFDNKELNHLIPIVNGTRVKLEECQLKNGDYVFITLPIGGGTNPFGGLF